MKTIRTFLIFAFGAMSGAAWAAAASPAFEAHTIRLFDIAVHRYVPRTDGMILERRACWPIRL